MSLPAQPSELATTESELNLKAYQLGVDHARFSLRRPRAGSVPTEFLRGYDSFKGRKKSTGNWAVKKWLALRLSALRRHFILTDDITPDFLEVIRPATCPVTLIPLTTGTGTETDCSIDRLISNGAYAKGNLVAMSAKANNAKGDLTFDEVLENASKPAPQNGLTQKEWARLLTLMFGAEAHANGNRRTTHVPLCTAIPHHIYFQPTQLLQEMLLAEARESNILTKPFWREKTRQSLGNTRLYDATNRALKEELERCEYAYDAWFNMTPFEPYLRWFSAMEPHLARYLQNWNQAHHERNRHQEKYALSWAIDTQGKAHQPTCSGPG